MANNPDHDWEEFGRRDPYFGVVSLKRFHRDRMTDADRDAFFRSGSEHIEYLLGVVREHMVPGFRPKRALDFGCGVGRCTLPLAARCGVVVGMDISRSMLDEARANADRLGVRNAEWVESDDALSRLDGLFDFIHCFIVFQHIPPPRGEAILRRLIDRLEPDGVACLQFLYHRDTPAPKRWLGAVRKRVRLVHGLANLAYGFPFNYPLMQKNCYDLNRILNLLQKSGCGNCHIRFEGTGEMQSAIVFFGKRPDAVPYDAFYRED